MSFPSDFSELVESRKQSRDLSVQSYPLISITAVPGEESDSNKVQISDWTVESFDEHSITFHMRYEEPIEISQNDEPESVTISLRLSELADAEGRPLPVEETLTVTVPRQIPDEKQADSIAEGSSTTEFITFAILVLNFLFSASLAQVWGLLNGMQLTVHLPVFRLKVPANALFFLTYMIEVATFDPVPVEAIWAIWNLPAKEPWSPSFDSAGYSYVFVVENFGMGAFFLHIFCAITIVFAVLPLLPCAGSIVKHRKFTEYRHQIFFGSILRLFFEGYLEFTIAICISAVNMQWDLNQGFAVGYCNVLTILIGVILVGLFIYIPVYYLVNIDLLD